MVAQQFGKPRLAQPSTTDVDLLKAGDNLGNNKPTYSSKGQ
jgi:hypothetical protein